MLVNQKDIGLSEYSPIYDLMVPKDNSLRKINDIINFRFVYQELVSKYCFNNGHKAQSPIRMFNFLLLITIYTLSDVDVGQRSLYDISFKYFLEMSPAGCR